MDLLHPVPNRRLAAHPLFSRMHPRWTSEPRCRCAAETRERREGGRGERRYIRSPAVAGALEAGRVGLSDQTCVGSLSDFWRAPAIPLDPWDKRRPLLSAGLDVCQLSLTKHLDDLIACCNIGLICYYFEALKDNDFNALQEALHIPYSTLRIKNARVCDSDSNNFLFSSGSPYT